MIALVQMPFRDSRRWKCLLCVEERRSLSFSGRNPKARSEEVIIWLFFCLMRFSDRPGFAA